MILQFIERGEDTLSVTKSIYFLYENRGNLSLSILEELLESGKIEYSQAEEKVIKKTFERLKTAAKSYRTPLDDAHKIPFIIDKDERPLTAANSWLRFVARRGSPKTWKTYAYALLDFLQFLEANHLEWQNIDDDILLSYRLTQESFHNCRTKEPNRKLKKKTIQYRLLVISLFYQYALKKEYINENPITLETVTYSQPVNSHLLSHLYSTKERVQPAIAYNRVEPNPAIKSHSREVIWSWIDLITNKRDKLIAKIMYQTGIRREEVVLWKIDQIPKIITDQKDISFEIMGKGGKTRLVTLPFNTYTELIRWIQVQRRGILKRSKMLEDDHYFVWVKLKGGHPLLVSGINSFFREVSKRHGTKITPHMMRHSFAMEQRCKLYEMGKKNPEKILQEMLGHSSIVTTMTTYGHISPQDLSNESAESLDLILSITEKDQINSLST